MATVTPTESPPRVSVEHLEINERGDAKLIGHRIKVKHIVGLVRYQGYTAGQIQSEAYPHLSLAQIHAALAYYYDHQADIDRRMEEDKAFAEREHQKQVADPEYQQRIARLRARWAELKRNSPDAHRDFPQETG
jgi:uncharacterized protein (DUF433 family)